MSITKTILSVEPLDEGAMDAARLRQAQLAKPPGSLGRLEELSIQLAGITGNVHTQIKKNICWYLPQITVLYRKVFPVLHNLLHCSKL